jgi:hypothetical protein
MSPQQTEAAKPSPYQAPSDGTRDLARLLNEVLTQLRSDHHPQSLPTSVLEAIAAYQVLSGALNPVTARSRSGSSTGRT